MVSDYSTLLAFFSLALISISAGFAGTYNRQLRLIQASKLANNEKFRHYSDKLNIWIKITLFFIYLLIAARIVTNFSAPDEFLAKGLLNAELVHYLLVGFIYLIFWFLILYFLNNHNDIDTQEKIPFLTTLFRLTFLLLIFDTLSTMFLYAAGFDKLFPIVPETSFAAGGSYTVSYPEIVLIGILFLLSALLFTVFIVKRSLRIIRNYWIAQSLLLVALFLHWYNNIVYLIGWNESSLIKLKLLSFDYGFSGWIVLIFFCGALFFNLSAIILLNIRDKLATPRKTKRQVVRFLKLGFAAISCLTLLVLLPELLMKFY